MISTGFIVFICISICIPLLILVSLDTSKWYCKESINNIEKEKLKNQRNFLRRAKELKKWNTK